MSQPMNAPSTGTTVQAFEDYQVEAEFGPLFVRVWAPRSAGVPILLLHDSLGSVQLWRDFPQLLAQASGRAVIAYDRAGFGQSVVRQDPISPDFILTEAKEGVVPVMAALGLKQVILFGHSVGGGMALSAAATLGDKIAGVVTVAAQGFVEDHTLAGVRQAKAAFAQPGQVERLARYHGERAPWVLEAWIETWLKPSYADWSLRDVLPRITCPVLAMHGADDEFGTLAHPEMIAERVSGVSRLRVFEGVAHMPHREATSELLAEVRAFLDLMPAA